MDRFNYQALAQHIVNQGINLAESYEEWTKLAFSLSNLGEAGRDNFHRISSLSSKYNYRESDKKFDEALRNNKKIDISSFVWLAQQAGVDTNRFFSAESMNPIQCTAVRKIQQKELCSIPFSYVEKSASFRSDFVYFLTSIFDKNKLESPTIERLVEEYAIGATKNGNVIFWQIDTKGKVRAGKIMSYDKETGHRKKEVGSVGWVHTLLKKKGLFPAEWELTQCFFGEHLLRLYPEKTVCLVESEKSAIIGAGVFPCYVWLATGGKCNLSTEKLAVLRDRKTIMFPDIDAYTSWTEKAEELRKKGINIVVSDILERQATAEERGRKIDIADWLIEQLQHEECLQQEVSQAQRRLEDFRKKNKNIDLLINSFELELIEAV